MGKKHQRHPRQARGQPPWTAFARMQDIKEPNGGTVEVYANNRYVVIKTTSFPTDSTFPPLVHLSIRRADRSAIHDWRDHKPHQKRTGLPEVAKAWRSIPPRSGSSIAPTSSTCGCLIRRFFGSLSDFASGSSLKAPTAAPPSSAPGSPGVARKTA